MRLRKHGGILKEKNGYSREFSPIQPNAILVRLILKILEAFFLINTLKIIHLQNALLYDSHYIGKSI